MSANKPILSVSGEVTKYQMLYRVAANDIWHLSSGYYETPEAMQEEAPKGLIFTDIKRLRRSEKTWVTKTCKTCGYICKPEEDHTFEDCARHLRQKLTELYEVAKEELSEDKEVENFKEKHRVFLRANEAFRHLQAYGSHQDPIEFEDVKMCYEQLYYSTLVHPEQDVRNTAIEFTNMDGKLVNGTIYEMCIDRIHKGKVKK